MPEYRNLAEVTEEYFRNHPGEMDAFLTEIFEAYAADGDSATLLSELRVIARVKGVTQIAEQIGMTRQGLQKPCLQREIHAWIISMRLCRQSVIV